ncbi:hypothetical protein [Ancylobacter sp. G4_0304]|uniref:hypothetical protein n=1 Tax=Ancylobacter sp. G4_0304 TaxID=3114289 RepID=UPI0039C62897
MWLGVADGSISEAESEALDALIQARRCTLRPQHAVGRRQAFLFRFKPRRAQRSPDREASIRRRRMLGGSGALPDKLRSLFTESQRAVLTIIAGEVKHHGQCDLPIDKIAALAGCGRTTVQNALHQADRLGLVKVEKRPVRGAKNKTNLVRIVSGEWLAWIRRGPVAHRPIGSKTSPMPKNLNPTKNIEVKKEPMRGSSRPLGVTPGRIVAGLREANGQG